MQALFAQHLSSRLADLENILAHSGFTGLIITCGSSRNYFDDDTSVPFRSNPHFLHYCPAKGIGHALLLKPGKRPTLLFCKPDDYWHEVYDFGKEYWVEHFDIEVLPTEGAVWRKFASKKRYAFIGEETKEAKKLGLKVNPPKIMHALHWYRAIKSPYEVFCLEKAAQTAAIGHKAAEAAFRNGASELKIHEAYLSAVDAVDRELPYPSIIGLNEKGAILHYQNRRHPAKGNVMLIDAGYRFQFYGSDITRTHCLDSAHPVFKRLIKSLDSAQQELCAEVKAGAEYVNLHEKAHLKIAKILLENGVIHGAGAEEMVQAGITSAFFPHGLGHLLGIQVHDVGGLQIDVKGRKPQVKKFPTLRLQRALREYEVVTIEPGIYFIPMILNGFRKHKLSERFQWKLIDELIPCGGIRIEDNVLVQKDHSKNLSRPFLS